MSVSCATFFAFIFQLITVILFCLSFGQTQWLVNVEHAYDEMHLGLWTYCHNKTCHQFFGNTEARQTVIVDCIGGLFYLVQILATIGFVFMLLTFICMWITWIRINSLKRMIIRTVICAIFTCIFYGSGLVVFAIATKEKDCMLLKHSIQGIAFHCGIAAIVFLHLPITFFLCYFREVIPSGLRTMAYERF